VFREVFEAGLIVRIVGHLVGASQMGGGLLAAVLIRCDAAQPKRASPVSRPSIAERTGQKPTLTGWAHTGPRGIQHISCETVVFRQVSRIFKVANKGKTLNIAGEFAIAVVVAVQ
jgi:hypothetical protein